MTIEVEGSLRVSGELRTPENAVACYVLAHGAGAGMTHPFMVSVAERLADRGIATLTYQFPYMERGSRRPDGPKLAHATVRAAVRFAHEQFPATPLIAGGKSFGARMTSQAQALEPMPGVGGLAFLGFPLHPAGKPADDRADHLFEIEVPLLFLQGTRDKLAELTLLRPLVERLGKRATLKLMEGADHSFYVLKRSGRTDSEVLDESLDNLTAWLGSL
ncbi:MAG: alpha/beta family hydrolase [Pseudomonadota bacterium]